MQVKRFVAADMRRALELVRQAMGPDAIILSSSRTAEGVELLTTMGSDSELMQLQQQPLGKMAFSSASPMISDGAWSETAVIERAAKKHAEAPLKHAFSQTASAKMGKSGKQLADEIEQARLRMIAGRKAEESAKEFLVGKNTIVNAGIPRNSQNSQAMPQLKQEPRFIDNNHQQTYHRPLEQEPRYTPSSVQAAPNSSSPMRVDDVRKASSARPASSKVSVPQRRTPVPRPVMVERKQVAVEQHNVIEKTHAPMKSTSAMTAAERYPLFDAPEAVASKIAVPAQSNVSAPSVVEAKVLEVEPTNVIAQTDADVINTSANNNEHLLELQSEIADMRFLLEQQLERAVDKHAPVSASPIMAGIARRMERVGLPEDVVSKVINSCKKINSLRDAWPEALANLTRQVPVVGRDIVDEGGVFAFVGPTGVGKTTTIGKLAARYVMKHGAENVALITTDTYRIAAHDQLRSIARILRVPVRVVDESNSLESLLHSLRNCSLVLIDTAGFRHGDPQLKTQLASLSELPQIKTFVVLSTNSQAQMLKASVHAYGVTRLQGCVLTKLDETASLGEALGVAIRGWLPVAYTTDGQDIPKNIEVARAHQLVSKAIALIKKNPVSAVS